MKRAAAAALVAVVLTPAALRAQATESMAGTMGQWWTMIRQSFIAAAEAMPEEKYAFRPTGGAFSDVRTFAEQVKHVACANFGFFNEIEHKEPPADCRDGAAPSVRTKSEIVKYLRDSFEYADTVLRAISPANALDPAEGPYGGKSTRLGLSTLAVWHASDHYGQIAVYLRMNGVVPPASR